MKKIKCDVVVVGGSGGSMAANARAKFGLDTVLMEREEELRMILHNGINCKI